MFLENIKLQEEGKVTMEVFLEWLLEMRQSALFSWQIYVLELFLENPENLTLLQDERFVDQISLVLSVSENGISVTA